MKQMTFERAISAVYNGEDAEIIALFLLGDTSETAEKLREAAKKYALECLYFADMALACYGEFDPDGGSYLEEFERCRKKALALGLNV